MTNRVIFTLTICFLMASVSIAQRSINVHDHLLIKESDKYLYGAPEEQYEGSPYLNDTYVLGYVYNATEKFRGVLMRYNIAQDVIEFQENGERYALTPDPRIVKVEMGNQTFIVDSPVSKGRYVFLELLESGPVTLVAKSVVNYRKKSMLGDIPAKYTRSLDMYFLKRKGEFSRVGSLKNLLASFPDHHQLLSDYAAQEKISAKDKESLIKLVRYYNTIPESQK